MLCPGKTVTVILLLTSVGSTLLPKESTATNPGSIKSSYSKLNNAVASLSKFTVGSTEPPHANGEYNIPAVLPAGK